MLVCCPIEKTEEGGQLGLHTCGSRRNLEKTVESNEERGQLDIYVGVYTVETLLVPIEKTDND